MTNFDLGKHELLARVSALYYEQNLTQNQIATKLGLSRVKVYRLLREAREREVVRITIDWPIARTRAVEQELEQRFGLKHALVVGRQTSGGADPTEALSFVAARRIEAILADGARTMAVCVGQTTHRVIQAIEPDASANIDVAQAIGSLPLSDDEYDSSVLTRHLADKLGGKATYLRAPPLADSASAAEVVRSQRDIRASLDAAGSVDLALVGVGTLVLESSALYRSGVATSEDLERLIAEGAAGDLAWRILRPDGRLHDCAFNDRVIGVSLDDLRNIPETLAVAAGPDKSVAIMAALRTGAIDTLCTDEPTARAVLALL